MAVGDAKYADPKDALRARIANDFVYHDPAPSDIEKYDKIRVAARDLAGLLIEAAPAGRELSTALTKLEECVMHANAGIARAAGGRGVAGQT